MKKKVFRIIGSLIVLLVLFGAYGIFAEETAKADLNIPPPEKFVINTTFILGLILGIVYKATVGSIKNFYQKKFSLKKFLLPIVISLLTSFPAIVFLLPHLANPSGKFLPDFLYAFAVSYILIDISADLSKLTELISEKIEDGKRAKSSG